jgi:hypothetical protein
MAAVRERGLRGDPSPSVTTSSTPGSTTGRIHPVSRIPRGAETLTGERESRGEGEWIRRPCPASPRTRAGGQQNVMGEFKSDVVPVCVSSPTCSPSSNTGAAPIAHQRHDLRRNTVARVTRNLHASIFGKKSCRLFAMPLGWYSAGPCGRSGTKI